MFLKLRKHFSIRFEGFAVCYSHMEILIKVAVHDTEAERCSCLLRRCYLAFNFIEFDSLRSACQISKSRQKIEDRVKQAQ